VSAAELTRARLEASIARRRLAGTLAELQDRLKPGTLASNAWEGVKERSGDIAEDAVEAVKARPVPVAAALAAFGLFLARAPIKSAVSRLFAGEAEDDLVTTRLDAGTEKIDLTAPVAARRKAQGASA
jgi:hypothetical protein